jgi:putative transposase
MSSTLALPLDIDKLAKRVDAFQHLYNNHRPHGALAGMTPAKYLSITRAKEAAPSHMS